jgi:hypothetical protein
MPDQITTAFARLFSENIRLAAQQLISVVKSYAQVETAIKDKKYLDYVGVMGDPQPRQALVENTNLEEVPHTRRVLLTMPYDKSVAVPRGATNRMLSDPTNVYNQVMGAAYQRFLEKKAFQAAVGSSITAATQDLTEAVIAWTDQTAQRQLETGTVGMTAAKIILARERFELNSRGDSRKHLWLSPQAISDLLQDPDVTYPQQQALDMILSGKLPVELWGFTVHKSIQLPKSATGAGIRSNVAWCEEGMCCAIDEEVFSRIAEDPGKKFEKIIYMEWDFGWHRLQETDVFEIQAYESHD